jgi:hypothetical protein
VRETSVGEPFKVFFRIDGPAALESLSRRRVGEVEADDILAIHLALEVDQREDIEGLLFLQFEALVSTTLYSSARRV